MVARRSSRAAGGMAPRRRARLGAPAGLGRNDLGEPAHHPARAPALLVGVLREVLVAQQLDVRPRRGRDLGVALDLRHAALARHRRARQRELRHLVERGRRLWRRRPRRHEPLRERGVEGGQVLVARAERRPQGEVGGLAVDRVDRRQRPVRGQQLADADPHARRAHGRRPAASACRSGARRAAAQTSWSTPLSRTASMSSRTLSTTPSVASRSASSSASSACAQAIVSPDAGQLVELLAAQAGDRGADPRRRSRPARRAGARARSPPRAPGRGSRSSGRGSAA